MREVTPLKVTDVRNYRNHDKYKDYNSLYVVNTSDRAEGSRRTELLMTFDFNGNPRTIAIPNTWIPIDLTSYVHDIEIILRNSDFMHFVTRRLIAVIDPDVAQDALEEKDAIAEFQRIHGIDDSAEDTESFDLKSLKEARGKGKPNASSAVLNIMNKRDVTESSKLSALKAVSRSLTHDDFMYIIKEAKSNDYDRIKTWAGAELDARAR